MISVKYGLLVLVMTLASPKALAVSEAKAEESVYWCLMRGRPCDVLDYASPGTCETCGMALVTKDAYAAYMAEARANEVIFGVLLYRGFETLDAHGPIDLWGKVNEYTIVTVAEIAGAVTSAQGTKTVADYGFQDCPQLDVLLVPGGMGTLVELHNEALLGFIRTQHQKTKLTTSVCSGSWLLAKAGVLDGKKATSNKKYFREATRISEKVTWVPDARWVEDGKLVTSSGVSAGMDMALHVIRRLKGQAEAEKVASWAEYLWNRDPEDDPFAVELIE